MTSPSMTRPPRVEIPGEVWYSDQLSSFLAQLALTYGPIFTFVPQAGAHTGQEVVYLVGPEANRFVLLTHREHFSHDLGWTPVIGDTLGRGLLNMDTPEHTRHRALMNPAFTSVFMDRYLPLMQRVIAERTRHWLTSDSVDLLSEAREITFDVAAAALVGFDTGVQVDWLRERFYALLHLPDTEEDEWEIIVQRQLQIRDELQRMLLQLIDARRRAAPSEQPGDVLGMLVRARDEQGQPLTDEQLLAHVKDRKSVV